MEHYQLFINGAFVDARDRQKFEAIDPGTEQPIATIAQAGAADAEAAIAAARAAFDRGDWSGLPPMARMAKLHDLADQVSRQALRLAATECIDSGQVLSLTKFLPLLGVGFLRNISLYAATKFPWEEEIPVSGNVFAPGRDYIRREPIGVCVGIIPWNYPMMMAFWKIAPALATGNTVVLKPASNTALSALIIAEAAQAAGIPDGVLNILPGPGNSLGKTLCTHPDVDKITFTGSTQVGREIMRMASDTVKKVTLELGGKSANIMLDDCDMELAVEGACFGAFLHQGQLCESGTRVLVHSKIYDEFLDKMKKRAQALRVGYQLDPTSHLGPLVSQEQLATVERYVALGQQAGATLVTGGHRVEAAGITGGYYYSPTILADVDNKMRVAQEEIFGPVVCVMKFDDDEQAVAIANDSIYGLGGGVFSSNTARAERIARGIRTGTMWINNYHIFADFAPFGGYKQSGVGREQGAAGLHEYVQIKRLHVPTFADKNSNMTFQVLRDDNRVEGFCYACPTQLIAGHGSLSGIYKAIVELGCRRALVLTDPGVQRAGLADLAKNALVDFCLGIYDRITAEPDVESADGAVELARELRADCIVSVGGGSVIDIGKAVCVALKNGGKAKDYLNMQMLTEPQTPHIAIPTTAGTGSEVTSIAVFTSKAAGRKLFIVDPRIVPDVAILDPRFTMTLPRDRTASTAMDALTHAIEALTSPLANAVCDGHALQAIRLIGQNLPLVIDDGSNEQARLNMQIAATMAGMAFTIAQVGLAHSMAHALGMLHDVPHGAACGIVLPWVIRFNVNHAAPKLALVAQALGVDTRGMGQREAALIAADAVEALMTKALHPLKLRDVGVSEENLDVCAFHALADTTILFNARPVADPNDILTLFQQAH